jgi:hypothetical protein
MAAAPKPWWHSKTLWFNLVVALLAAAEAGFSILQPLLPVNAYAALTFLLTVGNAGLRVITTTALAMRAAAPATEEPQP